MENVIMSENKDWFKYCSYWRTHNRVLERMGGDVYREQVEITLSPINMDWKHFERINIRRHCTVSSPFDVYTHTLSKDLENDLIAHFGKERAWIMVHADVLPLIDWDKYTRLQNGGCDLKDILIDLEPKFYTQTVHEEPLPLAECTLESFYHDSLVPKGVRDIGVDYLGGIAINGQYHSALAWAWYDPKTKVFNLKMGVSGYSAGMDFVSLSCPRDQINGWVNGCSTTMREFFQVLEEMFPVTVEVEKVLKEIDKYITYKYLIRDVLLG